MKKCLVIVLMFILMFDVVYAKRGCCSHHGGVAGCSSGGRTICRDGSYSPSCTCTLTIKTVYGCTDSKAINYNKKANSNDNSCKYKKQIKDTNVVKYETEYIEDENMYVGEEKTEQYGEYGTEEVVKEVIVDSYGSVLEVKKETKKTTKEAKKAIIKKGTKQKEETNNDEKESNPIANTIIGVGLIGSLGYAFLKKRV